MNARTVDDWVTAITNAASDDAALTMLRSAGPKMLAELADQLYIEADGHGPAWQRRAIVREARA
jgi:hypothetical protein